MPIQNLKVSKASITFTHFCVEINFVIQEFVLRVSLGGSHISSSRLLPPSPRSPPRPTHLPPFRIFSRTSPGKPSKVPRPTLRQISRQSSQRFFQFVLALRSLFDLLRLCLQSLRR
jgi:hypothetical protein